MLVDYLTSPGSSDEAIRVFLARDLGSVPEADRYAREDEERDMVARWVPLDEAAALVLSGALHNPSAVVGILAAAAARAAGWSTLRPADAPWPERPRPADRLGRAPAAVPVAVSPVARPGVGGPVYARRHGRPRA